MNAVIPPVIHQTWRSDKLPWHFAKYSQTWKRRHPAWHHMLWTDEDLGLFVRTHYPQYEELYLRCPRTVQKTDVLRIMWLHHFGGIYADMDAECVKSFRHWWARLQPTPDPAQTNVVILCLEPPQQAEQVYHRRFIISNAVMASSAGHPLWLLLLEEMHHRICSPHTQFKRQDVLNTTGPAVLTDVVLAYWTQHAADTTASVWVLGCDAFCSRVGTGHRQHVYNPAEVLAIHWFANTWTHVVRPQSLLHLSGRFVKPKKSWCPTGCLSP